MHAAETIAGRSQRVSTPLARCTTRRVCVIGAGLGGLALAIRLQSSGMKTTLV